MMSRRNADYVRSVETVLTDMNVPFDIKPGRKHLKLHMTINGITYVRGISSSSSDQRAVYNVRSQLKRFVTERRGAGASA